MSHQPPDIIQLEADPAFEAATKAAAPPNVSIVSVARFSELVQAVGDLKDRPTRGFILGNIAPEKVVSSDERAESTYHTNLVYFLRDVVGSRVRIVISTDDPGFDRERALGHLNVAFIPREFTQANPASLIQELDPVLQNRQVLNGDIPGRVVGIGVDDYI